MQWPPQNASLSALNREITERKAADADLQSQIDSLEAGYVTQDKLNAEISARESADTTLQKNIDNLSSSVNTALASKLNIDGTNAMTADLNAGGNKIVSVGAPTSDTDSANKKYVDDNISPLQTEINTNAADIAAEQADRKTADKTLQTAITALEAKTLPIAYPESGAANNMSVDDSGNLTVASDIEFYVPSVGVFTVTNGQYTASVTSGDIIYIAKVSDGTALVTSASADTAISNNMYIIAWINVSE